jgi:hypothetical protein
VTATKPTDLIALCSACATAAAEDLGAYVARSGKHLDTEVVRRALGRVDGIRFSENLLRGEGLDLARDRDELIKALFVLRIAEQTAGGTQREGFAIGLNDVRTAIARILEGKDPA